MTTHYLSINGAAKHAGITAATFRTYRRDGRTPKPDATTGDSPNERHGWLAETIDAWQASRPGRGARTDLTPDAGQSASPVEQFTIQYLSLHGFAERADVAYSTIRNYQRQELLPPPDATTGEDNDAVLGWLPETVDAWRAGRPAHRSRQRRPAAT